MEEKLLPFDGVSCKRPRAAEALDLHVGDGTRVDSRTFFFGREERRRVVLMGCHDQESVRKNDVGVGHDGKNR